MGDNSYNDMDIGIFIDNFKKAFGEYELPIGFWYSEKPEAPLSERTQGCFIKYLKPVREGKPLSFNADSISCGGGRVYTGFSKPLPYIKDFVSKKELYKQTPEMVEEFIDNLDMLDKSNEYINFASLDKAKNFNELEGILFFATPDVLTGLISWTLFDTNLPDAVSVPFGSGCSSLISQTIVENKRNGHRTFLGFFDPSVRPSVEENILSFAIPMSRFKTMYDTINQSCLSGVPAWMKVKERINNSPR